MWGKEKVVAVENEHPALSEFKNRLYEGASVATELVRRGYVVITIDMFYWGERRMLLDADPASYRSAADDPGRCRCVQSPIQPERATCRPFTDNDGRHYWAGVVLSDDLRTLTISPAARKSIDDGLAASAFRSAAIAVSFSPLSTNASRQPWTSAG